MKIAFLTPEYPHFKAKNTGGLGTSISNLCQSLVACNVEVFVFVYGQEVNEVFEENGIQFHLIADKKFRIAKWYFYRKHIQDYVNEWITNCNIQLLEAPDWTGITAFLNFKAPLVIRFHGSDTYFCYLEKRKQNIKNFWFEKLAVKKAKAFIAPTDFAGKLSAHLLGLSLHKVITIHYALNTEQFQNQVPKQYDRGLILYIGTLIRKKGVFELPLIFKKVKEKFPSARLILIGNDSERRNDRE